MQNLPPTPAHSAKRSRLPLTIGVTVGVAIGSIAASSNAALTVYGGPTFNGTTGYSTQRTPWGTTAAVVGNGVGIGNVERFGAGPITPAGVRFNAAGLVEELIGIGGSMSQTYSVSASGTAVGLSTIGPDVMSRATRWDVGSTAPVELGLLESDGPYQGSIALAINDAGVAAGFVQRIEHPTGVFQTAARWNAAGVATRLPAPTHNGAGWENAAATFITNSGIVVGSASAFDANFNDVGYHAVRWDAAGVPTILKSLPGDSAGSAYGSPSSANGAGTVVGTSAKYDATGDGYLGYRPVRWDAGTGEVTELGVINVDDKQAGNGSPYAINDAGTAVGSSDVYAANGDYAGARAVRWNADEVLADPLGEIGGITRNSTAYDINSSGTSVGYVDFTNLTGTDRQSHAVVWSAAGDALDLNLLLDTNSGWILSSAAGITDTGWISGIGLFDPDGAGGQAAYDRLFLVQLPEPTFGTAMLCATMTLLLRRRAKI